MEIAFRGWRDVLEFRSPLKCRLICARDYVWYTKYRAHVCQVEFVKHILK